MTKIDTSYDNCLHDLHDIVMSLCYVPNQNEKKDSLTRNVMQSKPINVH